MHLGEPYGELVVRLLSRAKILLQIRDGFAVDADERRVIGGGASGEYCGVLRRRRRKHERLVGGGVLLL